MSSIEPPRASTAGDKERGQGFPQIIHDRARRAAEELHRLLLSLSTGAVVVYFLALTGKAEPALTTVQQIVAITSLVVMVSAVLSGIISSYADIRRNYFWASALQADNKEAKRRHYRSRDRWLTVEKTSAIFLIWLFAAGMLASSGYMLLRITGH